MSIAVVHVLLFCEVGCRNSASNFSPKKRMGFLAFSRRVVAEIRFRISGVVLLSLLGLFKVACSSDNAFGIGDFPKIRRALFWGPYYKDPTI